MRAIRLHPIPEAEHDCPHCSRRLDVLGWHIPGMRNLAELRCPVCEFEFYGDLAAGQALYTPMLIEKKSGVVHDKYGVRWFNDWLRDSYANRKSEEVSFIVENRRPISRQVVLLNCLDTLYGHSLLKLLNAPYYLGRNLDLILIIPPFLAWMVPEGVAEVWIVDLPLKRGTEWNDWVAREIYDRVEVLETASLCVATSHPGPKEYDISRFTNVKPFPLEHWEERLVRPTVTFIWRDDRIWSGPVDTSTGRFIRKLKGKTAGANVLEQRRLVVELAETLHLEWPMLNFGIAGLSEVAEGFPSWIEDLRCRIMDDTTEWRYCERYASSHVVVGVHGSNMLLPTAHAGGLVELIATERYGNFTQDVLFREARDCRDMFFRYRFVPTGIEVREVAQLVSQLLRGYEPFRRLINAEASLS